ncbi:cellulose biosynthesis protein BcsS [Methylocystis sp.]|uniref:cellulose biosynthesis protein BcsS n=1 Tax=Methylocystis sp. TaxID=1911079 RepID=UPI003DA22F67
MFRRQSRSVGRSTAPGSRHGPNFLDGTRKTLPERRPAAIPTTASRFHTVWWNFALRIPPDAVSALAGTQFGVLGSLEFRATPNDDLMLFASSTYTTAFRWGYFEVKPGILLPFNDSFPVLLKGKLFFGPHAALNSYRGDLQPMFGAHVTLMEIGPFYASLAGGYVRDQYSGQGGYTILETSVRF